MSAKSSRSDDEVVSRVDFGLLFVVFVVVAIAIVLMSLLDLRYFLLFVNVLSLPSFEGAAAASSSRFLFRRRRKKFEVLLVDLGGEKGERARTTLSSV